MLGILVLSLLPWMLVAGGAGYLFTRFLRAYERRSNSGQDMLPMEARLRELESALESTQQEVARLADEQQFTMRLLSERAGVALAEPGAGGGSRTQPSR